jgi:hypothetical protein
VIRESRETLERSSTQCEKGFVLKHITEFASMWGGGTAGFAGKMMLG